MLTQEVRANIHRLVRAVEKFTVISKKTNVGYFIIDGKRYGIQLQRFNYHPEQSNTVFAISLSIEVPTTSGLIYVPIAEFSSIHKDCFEGAVPRVRVDKHWISYQTSIKQKRNEIELHYVNSGVRRTFDVQGASTEDMLDDFESQVFQYNLSCSADTVVDDEMTYDSLQLVLEEFDALYSGHTEVSCLDIMHTKVSISDGKSLVIPHDAIADAIEVWVQNNRQF